MALGVGGSVRACWTTDAWCARSQEMHLLLRLGLWVLPGGPGLGAHSGSRDNNGNIWGEVGRNADV